MKVNELRAILEDLGPAYDDHDIVIGKGIMITEEETGKKFAIREDIPYNFTMTAKEDSDIEKELWIGNVASDIVDDFIEYIGGDHFLIKRVG